MGISFNENNYCKGWKAEIKHYYWCKSWQVNPDTYEDTSIEDFMASISVKSQISNRIN